MIIPSVCEVSIVKYASSATYTPPPRPMDKLSSPLILFTPAVALFPLMLPSVSLTAPLATYTPPPLPVSAVLEVMLSPLKVIGLSSFVLVFIYKPPPYVAVLPEIRLSPVPKILLFKM